MKKSLILIALSLILMSSRAQDSLKTATALRISQSPKIDGLLDDECWKNTEIITAFIQNTPDEGKAVSQITEVKLVYDDYALYVGAMLYDSSAEKILKSLGSRDDGELNADKFIIQIDPYNTRQDAYTFGVYASGVQYDYRFSDETYNGVWQSAVKVHDNGWSVEMLIPYSAIRFPNLEEQNWSVQFGRDIRRSREFDQWCLTPSGQANPQKFWGILKGISAIKPPLRLSLTPYLSSYYDSSPEFISIGNYSYSNAFSYNAGADIKYGLDERFTVDMTLLPDFGQVQSDNKVKNLSYKEVTYNDYRPFFQEGTELFDKDMLFYSRRIGKYPTLYSSVQDSLMEGELIKKNPSQAKLLNATKVSGRTNSGTGLGFFNALTNNTYAVIKDTLGKERNILTEPFTNYNVFVVDQQLPNSSNAYLINTNVVRADNNYRNANVTAAGFTLQNKKNTWGVDGSAAMSNINNKIDTVKTSSGLHYFASLKKISGSWQYALGYETMTNTYDRSDLGFQSINDYSAFNLSINQNIYKQIGFIFRAFNNGNIRYAYNYSTGLPTEITANMNFFLLFKDYSGIFFGGATSPVSVYDYNEPRVKNRYFRTSEWYWIYGGFTTDYRKMFAIDVNINTSNFLPGNLQGFPLQQGYGLEIKPRLRVNDKLSFICTFNYNFDPLNPGYASSDAEGNIYFGARELHTYVNTISSKYIFKNDLSLTLKGRHYWGTGDYFKYYLLLENGMVEPTGKYYGNHNFNYNVFNIDVVFSWQFSPGSVLSLAYKNAIEQDEMIIRRSYADNFMLTIQSPQINSLSLKVLYYLDYEYLRRKSDLRILD